MENSIDRGDLDTDPVCHERFDPDPVCPERFDPDPVNIRPDPNPCLPLPLLTHIRLPILTSSSCPIIYETVTPATWSLS